MKKITKLLLGGIAAAVSHMTRDRKGPALCYQMLIYLAVDSSLST